MVTDSINSGESNVSIKADLSKSIHRVVTDFGKGIGKLASLLAGKREADIKRYKMLSSAQTEVDCQLILSGQAIFDRGSIIHSNESSSSSSISNIFEIDAQQEMENLAGNLKVAVDVLKDTPDQKISDDEVDQDFFSRWRREAKIIGREDIQYLWGRLLAKEISSPESISLRTLDVVKNISSKEATCFRKAATYVIGQRLLFCDVSLNRLPECLTLDELFELNAAGLLSFPAQGIVLQFTPVGKTESNNIFIVSMHNHVMQIVSSSQIMPIPGILLSDVGRQIIKLCDYANPDNNFFDFIIKSTS